MYRAGYFSLLGKAVSISPEVGVSPREPDDSEHDGHKSYLMLSMSVSPLLTLHTLQLFHFEVPHFNDCRYLPLNLNSIFLLLACPHSSCSSARLLATKAECSKYHCSSNSVIAENGQALPIVFGQKDTNGGTMMVFLQGTG